MISVNQISAKPERFEIVDQLECRTLLGHATALEVFEYFERVALDQAKQGAELMIHAALHRGVNFDHDDMPAFECVPAVSSMN